MGLVFGLCSPKRITGEKPSMTSRPLSMFFRFRVLCALSLLVVSVLGGAACQPADDSNANINARPANTSPTAKPAATETKSPDPAPVGKEVKAAPGPALKSITPPDGAILAGVLNDLATSLPAPDATAAKAANESGTVTVEVVVNEKGVVVASSVVSGPQPLWRAAGEAARQARFDPPLHNGNPVKIAGVLTYEFTK
jgi:TonB family protein